MQDVAQFVQLGVPAAQLVGRRSWRRGQTAGGGSIPRWSTGKPQVVTRRKATGAGKKKMHNSFNWHKHCVTTWREPRRRRTEKSTLQRSASATLWVCWDMTPCEIC